MNLHFIVASKDVHAANARYFAESHFIELATGELLVSAIFGRQESLAAWKKHPKVTALPHPLSGQQIGPDIAARLSELGVTAQDTVFSVAEKASKRHRLLALHI